MYSKWAKLERVASLAGIEPLRYVKESLSLINASSPPMLSGIEPLKGFILTDNSTILLFGANSPSVPDSLTHQQCVNPIIWARHGTGPTVGARSPLCMRT